MVSSPILTKEMTLDRLYEMVERKPGILHAILDACDEPRVPAKAAELGSGRAVSLYAGLFEEDYWAMAPYLVEVDAPVLRWIVSELWTTPWGVLAIGPADLNTLRKHLRRFVIIRDPGGKEWYFRFYDPRVLPMYLRSCQRSERTEFFGPVEAFLVNEQDRLVVLPRDVAE